MNLVRFSQRPDTCEAKMSMKLFTNDTRMREKTVRRMSSFNFTVGILLCVTAAIALFGPLSPKAHGQGKSTDLCKSIPGDEIAKAIGGKIMETKSFDGRCVYIVHFGQTDPPSRAFVIYRHEASEYGALKDAMEGNIKTVKGIGDEAVGSFDSQSNRYWLLVVKRGKVTYQVSGDNEEFVRKVAVAALRKLNDAP